MVYASPWDALLAMAAVINPVLTGGDELQSTPALVSLTSDVTVSWSLEKPVGSTTTLSSASGTSTSYTPDLEGQYVVTALHESGGRTTNSVTLVPASTIPTLTGGGVTRNRAALETITSDVAIASFTLSAPSGSDTVLSAASGTSTTFTPDVAGYYEVTATHADGGYAKTGISLSFIVPNALLSPIDVEPLLAGAQVDQLSSPVAVLTPSWSA